MLGRLVNDGMTLLSSSSSSTDKKNQTRTPPSNREKPLLAGRLLAMRNSWPGEGIWGDTLPLFRKSNLNVINLETTITSHLEKAWENKAFHFRMDPHNLPVLKEAEIDYASLANNHILDFGVEGMVETCKELSQAKIQWAGVGHSFDEARKHALLESRSSGTAPNFIDNNNNSSNTTPTVTVAAFSFSDHGSCIHGFNSAHNSPADLWAADIDKTGINFLDRELYDIGNDKLGLKDLLKHPKFSSQADLSMVSMHWGPNYSWRPSNAIQNMADFLASECAIDIVHGHSSHHVQGIQFLQSNKEDPEHITTVLYGCGDFITDYAVDPVYRNDLGALYQLHYSGCESPRQQQQVRFEQLDAFPTRIDGLAVHRLYATSED
ncbi:unnamed protein product, partial [Heterosigma akashiwo]